MTHSFSTRLPSDTGAEIPDGIVAVDIRSLVRPGKLSIRRRGADPGTLHRIMVCMKHSTRDKAVRRGDEIEDTSRRRLRLRHDDARGVLDLQSTRLNSSH